MRQKGTKVLPKPWPPGPRIAKGWGLLCAIHKANVTVALLFQTLIELKKRAATRYVTARRINVPTSEAGVEVTDDY